MNEQKTPFETHVLVCTKSEGKGKVCGPLGGEKLCQSLKDEIKSRGLKNKIRINKSGCLGKCEQGPNVMIYPEQKWYSSCAEENTKELLEKIIN